MQTTLTQTKACKVLEKPVVTMPWLLSMKATVFIYQAKATHAEMKEMTAVPVDHPIVRELPLL